MGRIMFSVLGGLLVFGAAACEGSDDPDNGVATQSGELRRGPTHRIAEVVTQTNLVADTPEVAEHTDPNLVNAWGLAFSNRGPAWVSSAGRGLSQVYDAAGNTVLSVTIPPAPGGESPTAPTGQAFNDRATAFAGDAFIFVTEGGTIAGWQPADGTTAVLRVDNSGQEASYKGVAIGQAHGKPRLYAADFHNGKVDVFDETYAPIDCGHRFVDNDLPAHYAPFNIATHDGLVFVTYAQQDDDAADDVKGPGHGFVDVFSAAGGTHTRLVSRGALDSPWGMAITPSPDDDLALRLLVGNFGDGRIDVYRVPLLGTHGRVRLEGTLGNSDGEPLVIDGLWSIAFGTGVGGFERNELYFTAGPGDEQHGLFGKLAFP